MSSSSFSFATGHLVSVALMLSGVLISQGWGNTISGGNLALAASPVASFSSGSGITAINTDYDPRKETDDSEGAHGNWPHRGTEWVEYRWEKAINTGEVRVYWWRDYQGINLPVRSRLLYWSGTEWSAVSHARGLGVEPNCYNITTFDQVTTTRLRLEFDSMEKFSTGILQWKVIDAGNSPPYPPRVKLSEDQSAFPNCDVLLGGLIRPDCPSVKWTKVSGPGEVKIAANSSLKTSAKFSSPGDYVLQLQVNSECPVSANVRIHVMGKLPAHHLDRVYTRPYQIQSTLWDGRIRALVVHWIPHCVSKLEEAHLAEGGLDNFIQAGNKLAGLPYQGHFGPPWSDAYVFNTVEAMCDGLMFQAPGDREVTEAQDRIRKSLARWIPIILKAQESDGYLQTRFTLGTENELKKGKVPPRWTYRGDHEGYVGGYLIDAAIAHYLMTGGQDRRLYDAARRLADCWSANIGPAPKKTWFDGHEEMEQALTRLAAFMDQEEGPGTGAKYLALAKFLLDSRQGGGPYDQSQLPVRQQNEAVGHAVRAVYCYSGMADVALQTGDPDYYRAVDSIWSNLVNKKYYITGGVGSGESAEGFGPNFSLPNKAYCESCSSCGEMFFQQKLNLISGDAVYADLLEETLYNALLGSFDLNGDNFTYTNPLDSSENRYPWHTTPCCVGNIPRTILRLPEFMYATSRDGLYVNLYVGSRFTVPRVAGTEVEMVQTTNYPWDGSIALTVNPATRQTFSLRLRIPRHDVSELYRNSPDSPLPTQISVNGVAQPINLEKGYAVITRAWSRGDKIEFTLPLTVQRVRADERVAADRGRVALRYGPLIYSIESVDQDIDQILDKRSIVSARWNSQLLGGVVSLQGEFKGKSPMTAIPYYARNNRGGRSLVWIAEE